jgi:anti-sigma-K factor RskA
VDRDAIHELSAGYALDALDPADEETFVRHLETCARCRDDVVKLREAAAALAHDAAPVEPPPSLRFRVLAAAQPERSTRSRIVMPLAAAAAAFAAAALGLGLWAASLHGTAARRGAMLAVLADPAARRIPLEGSTASLVVGGNGDAVLVSSLERAPAGKAYELWVIRSGVPARAGVFSGRGTVPVAQRVDPGVTVAITVERAGGVAAPTGKPIAQATV